MGINRIWHFSKFEPSIFGLNFFLKPQNEKKMKSLVYSPH